MGSRKEAENEKTATGRRTEIENKKKILPCSRTEGQSNRKVGKSTWRRTSNTQQDTGGARGREHRARQRNEGQKNLQQTESKLDRDRQQYKEMKKEKTGIRTGTEGQRGREKNRDPDMG